MSNHKEFLIFQKRKYYKIGYIVCPALNNEKVYFNNQGFNHLIRKRGKLRSIYEQRRRLELLVYAKSVIKDKKVSHEYLSKNKSEKKICFWILQKELDNKIIKIVIRKINDGKIHFFSIMDKNKTPSF